MLATRRGRTESAIAPESLGRAASGLRCEVAVGIQSNHEPRRGRGKIARDVRVVLRNPEGVSEADAKRARGVVLRAYLK